ncbi:hypothetical protein [Clostridium intestinale]|jgi:hypothetical protein|uniref:Uncharacterized protein n=2 Tax=Clostridium intestinale TaxID=36845 RepID=U2N103_9CLOT|nr:hypothetical protein [Clostridium intestinale]ERK29192.1 hypothetical protein CINTURNW_3502 [Clostridium intestinale URNW]QLY80568.1 hypothetical protein HZF06_03000 [Clostridium intestinale]
MVKKTILNEEELEKLNNEDNIEEVELEWGAEKIEGEIIKEFTFSKKDLEEKNVEKITNETLYKHVNEDKGNVISKRIRLNARTPKIDGEEFEVTRSYKLRPSTAKMLNEIKGMHSNVNIHMNTIIDSAIRYYYGNLKSGNLEP